MKYSFLYPSPLGTLEIQIKNHQIYSVSKPAKALDSPLLNPALGSECSNQNSPNITQKIKRFLYAYFSGQNKEPPSLPLFLRGSVFQQKVWQCLCKIPYGQTKCYSDIAQALGSLHLTRAVGSACAQNPFLIIVPCHRVVAKKGLGGFALGLPTKKFLLKHEQSASLICQSK